jgi:hypothetical protein
VFGQKPKPILKSVPTPNVTKTFSPNQTGSKGPNLPNRNTMPADILIPCQDSRIPYQSQSNNSEKDKLSQSQGIYSFYLTWSGFHKSWAYGVKRKAHPNHGENAVSWV